MAERRMFAKTIIDSDAFLDMPMSARLLYYDLGMRADDDGFVNSPKKIMRISGASSDDLKLLTAKKFIIPFDSGVCVIKHWKLHNYIANDRYKETVYLKEKNQLSVKDNKVYVLETVELPELQPLSTECIHIVDGMDTQVRLGKVRLGEVRLDNTIPVGNCPYTEIMDLYNTTCKSLPKIKAMTDVRKGSVQKLWKAGTTIDAFKEFFQSVEKSDFLCGRTERKFGGCGFDWIFNNTNRQKILEGNYVNRCEGNYPKWKIGDPIIM